MRYVQSPREIQKNIAADLKKVTDGLGKVASKPEKVAADSKNIAAKLEKVAVEPENVVAKT